LFSWDASGDISYLPVVVILATATASSLPARVAGTGS
jgi:hypothetical protein